MRDDIRRGLLCLAAAWACALGGCAAAGNTPGGTAGSNGSAGAAPSGAAGGPGAAGAGEAGGAAGEPGTAGGNAGGGGAGGSAGGDAGAGGAAGTPATGAAGAAGGAGGSVGGAGGAAGGPGGAAGSAGAATGGADGAGYPPPNPAVDQACTPAVTFTNMFPATTGGMRFSTAIPDVVATMQQISRTVCRFIYRKPEEVKKVTSLSLVIDEHGGVAQTAGNKIQFDANYIGGIGGSADAISFEIHGVLAHEDTHVWQNAGAGGTIVEAMADYVRYRSGYDKLSRRRPGGNWTDPYTTGGFFIVWVEDKYDKDWGYKINVAMKDRTFDYGAFIQKTFGKTADALWAEYQADISH